MEQVRLSTQEALLYGMLVTAAIGFVVGLVPLAIGIWKKKIKLGILGLLTSTLGGALLGLLLAVPIAVVFIWRIMRQPKVEAKAEEHQASDSSSTDNP